jgi:AcrR family transcriptional regulator
VRAATARAASRLGEILVAAQSVFGRHGYRRTQVSDVARELGVSSGLVYHYFESKEALFHTTLDRALAPDEFVAPSSLPVATPERRETLAMVRRHAERWVAAPLLEVALANDRPSDPRAELESIVSAFYDGAERRRIGADLLERSALERPDLAALWFGELRRVHFDNVTRYIQKRIDAGQLRNLPDAGIVARIVIEIVVFFSRHRHRDPYEQLDDTAVRENVLRFVVAALVP